MGKDTELSLDEQIAAEMAAQQEREAQEADDVFETLAAVHDEKGNLDNLPQELSRTDSDSDEDDRADGSDEGEDENQDEPQETAAPIQAESKPESDDVWASASEAQRREFEKLEHADRSNRGRVSALTREVESLRAQVAQLQKQPEPPKPKESGDLGDDFKAFADDYPEIADMFRKMNQRNQELIGQISQQVQGMGQAVQPIVQKHRHDAHQSELDRVLAVHPDALELSATDQFQNWLHVQSSAARALFDSDLAEDNIMLMSRYKAEHDIQSSKPDDTEQPDDRLAAMESVPSKRGGPRARTRKVIPDDDFDAAFEQMAQQLG